MNQFEKFQDLPPELKVEILKHMDYISLAKTRCTSKGMYELCVVHGFPPLTVQYEVQGTLIEKNVKLLSSEKMWEEYSKFIGKTKKTNQSFFHLSKQIFDVNLKNRWFLRPDAGSLLGLREVNMGVERYQNKFNLNPLAVYSKDSWVVNLFLEYRTEVSICALTSNIWVVGFQRSSPQYFLLHAFLFEVSGENLIDEDEYFESDLEEFISDLFENKKPFKVYSTGAILKDSSYAKTFC